MADLRAELEEALEELHAALDRGDQDAAAERLIQGAEEVGSARSVIRPNSGPFAGAFAGSGGWALYAVAGATPASGASIARLHRGRDGVWRASGMSQSLVPARGDTVAKALEKEARSLRIEPDVVPTPQPNMPGAPTEVGAVVWLGLERRGLPEAEVDAAEGALGARFPSGYREYVVAFGAALDSNFVRVYPPARVVSGVRVFRRRVDAYWFWSAADDGFGLDEATDSILIADTVDGDELVFHPARNGATYMLPRHAETVVRLPGTFTQAIAWMTESGDLGSRATLRYAVPLGKALIRKLSRRLGHSDTGHERATEALRNTDTGARVIANEFRKLVLLPVIGGTAYAEDDRVHLEYDPGASPEAVAKLVARLTKLGYEE